MANGKMLKFSRESIFFISALPSITLHTFKNVYEM